MPTRLARESSPYLRRHADNPMDWYPWGPEALERAAREDRPILLSVGYSSCHWCHVMEHESCEDPVTAGLMNRLFQNDEATRALVRAAHGEFLQSAVIAGVLDGTERPDLPLLRDRGRIDGRAAAYVCSSFSCRLPVTDPDALLAEIRTVNPS